MRKVSGSVSDKQLERLDVCAEKLQQLGIASESRTVVSVCYQILAMHMFNNEYTQAIGFLRKKMY